MPRYLLLPSILVIIINLTVIWGHGRLIEPPSRASAWRYGFQTPPNYNDHELYCGGFSKQWHKNQGKCGLCGDAFDAKIPRPHEYGGIYYTGTIVRKYPKNGIITIRIELTANHFGHFEFRVCDNYKNTTQECLDKHLLSMAYIKRGSVQNALDKYRFYPTEGNKIYEMRYRLPNLTCKHCVLQWRYIAGNNWGTCPNGTETVGCGPQEEFRACSDISIGLQHISDIPNDIDSSTVTFSVATTESTNATNADINLNVDLSNKVLVSLVTVFITFILVIIVLFMLYLYYYKIGKRIKGWIKGGKTDNKLNIPPPPMFEAPVPPPRKARAPVPPKMYYNNESNA